MPVHRVPVSDVETYVEVIEQNERIVNVVTAGDGALIIFTESRGKRAVQPGEKEVR